MYPSRLSTAFRGLSVRAPIANEEELAQFRSRIALTSVLMFALAGGFWLLTLVLVVVMVPGQVARMWDTTTSHFQLGATFTAAVAWLLARFGPKNATFLDLLDCVSSFAMCSGWALMIFHENMNAQPELVGLLACTYTLVLRAALVPSTPMRTALLGLVGFLPILLVTHARASTEITRTTTLATAVYVGIWASLGIATTTIISFVIYGLRIQVRKAMQLGQYRLEEKIGEGGMGEVYRASHAMLRRATAIKLLQRSADAALDRFEREVQITSRLTHPNTIAVFDYGRTPEGIFYYAMEYVDGISLDELVRKHGPQPVGRVVHLLRQTCGALHEAHEAGLVHRDVKPANIMLTTRGGVPDVVKVLDFGLVKETRESDSAPDVSMPNVVLGTPHYMAPESIVDPRTVDGRADIYALGATAFYLLTGKNVFDGKSALEVCGKQLHEPPMSPSFLRAEIPEGLSSLVLACLSKDRKDRPKTAGALAEALAALGIPEWTTLEARDWWSERSGGKVPAARPSERQAAPVKTVAIALGDRV